MEAMAELERLGRYTLREKIATGGMAELFLATLHGDAGFERPVAIKRILPHLVEDPEFVRMFVDEAKIAVQLSHPCIAQILDLGQADGFYYIAQEFVHGRNLSDIFHREVARGRTVPVGVAAHIMMRVSEALHHAHRAETPAGQALGIVHRDVSLQNVILSFDGQVKVVDFGLAKARGRATQTGVGIVKGKLAYMAPEQAGGEAIDHRVDVYAAGICLFELLTGQRLFYRDTDKETILAVQAGKVPRLGSILPAAPPELEAIVQRALARDLGERYATALELHDDLEAFAYGYDATVSATELAAYLADVLDQRPTEDTVPNAAPLYAELEDEETEIELDDRDLDERSL
jgi:serine/threonine-protein kinase